MVRSCQAEQSVPDHFESLVVRSRITSQVCNAGQGFLNALPLELEIERPSEGDRVFLRACTM